MTGFAKNIAKSALAALFVLVTLIAGACAQQTFSVSELRIVTASGETHRFSVELALSASQRQQGLMYREKLAADHGMLFDFGKDEEVLMWMKNTLIPLDMIFLNKEGVITHINENATPLSQVIISSQGPVRFVLEVGGGVTRQLGIAKGDRVVNATVQQAR